MGSRNAYVNEIRGIQNSILRMGSLVEQSVYDSVVALMSSDTVSASQVILGDDLIDQMYAEIEERCIILLATQQPMAKDLRMIFADIKILVNLERMADYAVDIAQVVTELRGHPIEAKAFEYIPEMAGIVQLMIKRGLDSYSRGDIEKAKEVCLLDDKVDRLFADSYKYLIESMKCDPNAIVRSLFVGRYLERIADHATNIGEEVIFIATGQREELN
ncbi:MAG: phosphate signaling complex protein PhoU [Peptococcaceae bacterium]|nr:phosphate signaling complex protein PhoU [Peptococcaceae bacterium]